MYISPFWCGFIVGVVAVIVFITILVIRYNNEAKK